MHTCYTVGVTGGSGAGKTYFLQALSSHFKTGEICLISQDNYYLPRQEQPKDENGVQNFDLPDAINRHEFLADMLRLKQGQDVRRKEYTFNNPTAVSQNLELKAASILVVEGLFIQHFTEVEKELDLKIFIEAQTPVKLDRRLQRDLKDRGYERQDVLYRYAHHVTPVYEKLIEPLKYNADLIIPNNTGFQRALAVLVPFLKSQMNR